MLRSLTLRYAFAIVLIPALMAAGLLWGPIASSAISGNEPAIVVSDVPLLGPALAGASSLDVVAMPAALPTTTVIISSLNPSFRNQAVTFTSTTTSSATVNVGVVNFVDNTTAVTLCSNVTVNASGTAACFVAGNTLSEGTHSIQATYVDNATFSTSNGSLTQTVNFPTSRVGNTFTNAGGISIPDSGIGTSVPYPSNIIVSGLGGTITKVTLTLTNASFPRTNDLNFLLVGPNGDSFVFWSDAGGAVASTGITVTLDDVAAIALPNSGAVASGTHRPTDYAGDSDTWPAPAPAAVNVAAPAGASTFASVFNGDVPNGTWSLYPIDDGGGGGSSSIGSWSLSFTLAPAATTTSVTSSSDPSVFGQPVTFTATVSTAGLGTPTGNVQFFDGLNPIGGAVALNASGQAQLTTSSLSVGNHTITAQYAGDVPSGFNASTGSLTADPQTVNKASTTTGITSNRTNPVGTDIQTTFTATISPVAPGSGTRTGTVTFSRNGTPVCSNVAINASGQADCNLTFTIAGNYNITATYSGDANFNPSSSTTFVQQVLGPTAANVSIGGRVTTGFGRGISSVSVTLIASNGETRSVLTNTFGYYRFADVSAGETYFLTYAARGYQTVTSSVTALDSFTDLNVVMRK